MFVILFANVNIKADMPVKEKIIQIVDFEILKNDTTHVGDTIEVAATFISSVSGKVTFGLSLYGAVTMVDDTTKNHTRTDTLTVEKDSLNTMIFYIKPTAAIASNIGFGVSLSSEDPYILNPVLDNTDVRLASLGSPDWYRYSPIPCEEEITNIDYNCAAYSYIILNNQVHSPCTTAVNFSGKVVFTDWWTPKLHPTDPPMIKGTLNNVWLFWKDLNDSYGKLYHPVPFQDKPIEGVHFVRCGEDGSFSFNFEYQCDSLIKPGAIWQMVLLIGKENEVLNLISQKNHGEISGMENPDKPGTNIRVYTKEFPVSCNDCTLDPISFEQFTDGKEGGIFRHITLTRKFLIDRLDLIEEDYDTELPARVNVEVRYQSGDNYYSGNTIYFVHHPGTEGSSPTPVLMSHEYAHHYHKFLGDEGEYYVTHEGWAVFMSMAFTSWENNNFNDYQSFVEDTEMGPFTSLYDPGKSPVDDYPRFGNISKVGYPDDGFDMCRFTCYLWNVYDSKNDGDFMSPRYEGYNNDDVDGFGRAVFDFFVNYNKNYSTLTSGYNPVSIRSTPFVFNSLLKLTLAPGNTELQTSIQRIYDFMEFEKPTLPLETTVRMRSPQIELSTAIPPGDYKILNFQSKAYPESIGIGQFNDFVANVHDATWTWSFSNREAGVQIYQSSNQNGPFTPLPLIPYTSTGYSYNVLKNPWSWNNITATNIGGGDSYGYFDRVKSYEKISFPDESESEFISNVYPNPAVFSVSVESPEFLNKNIVYEIYDLSANLVHSGQTRASSNKLFVELPAFLNSGTYFINAKESDTETTLLSQTFIIQR